MSKVSIIAKLVAQPDKRAELVEALKFGLEKAGEEPGTLMYVLHEDTKEPNTLWFYEIYSDEDALKAHGKADDWMKENGRRIGPLLDGRPEITMLRPVGGKGL